MGVNITNLVTEWPILSCKNIIQTTWNVSSFLRPSTNAASAFTFISASHISAHNLKDPYPPSFLKALIKDFVDRCNRSESYYKQKDGLMEKDRYTKISLQEYLRFRRLPKGVPKSIPYICVMKIKKDKIMAPDHTKSCIVVPGNLENPLCPKS